MTSRVIALLPTYNEAENIRTLIPALLEIGDYMEALVVDDDSPDGTWRVALELEKQFPGRVHLLHRKTERGRGSAGLAGFAEAVRLGADLVVEMDADWSHHPRHIPAMLEKTQEADVVIGSRLIPGGGERGRNWARRWITLGANWYLRTLLHLSPQDCTSGFRVFRREILSAIRFDRLDSNGPAIVQEMLLCCRAAGARFAESPILFEERRAGTSTFNRKIMLQGLLAPWRFLGRNWQDCLREESE